MTNKSMVYVVQETDLNIALATRYGEITALLPSRKNITVNAQPVLRELRNKLKDFNDEDYLLLVGDPVIIALAVYIAGEVNRGKLRVLKYDRKLGDYYVVNINLHDRESRRL